MSKLGGETGHQQFSALITILIGGAFAIAACLVVIAFAPGTFASAFLQSIALDRTPVPLDGAAIRWVAIAASVGATLAAAAGIGLLLTREQLRQRVAGSRAKGWTFTDQIARDVALLRSHRFAALGLLVAIVGGAVLRTAFLAQPIGYDEATTHVYFASRGFIDVISDYSIPNNHVFHTVLMHAMVAAGAESPAMLRIPAFLAGIALIPVSFWLAQRFFARWEISLLSAALIAVAPAIVEYSAQARGYTFGALFFVLSFVAVTYVRERESAGAWVLFVTSSALSLYTIPSMALGLGIPCIWLLISLPAAERHRTLLKLMLAGVATIALALILYTPVIIRSGWASLVANSYIEQLAWSELIGRNARNAARLGACWTGALPPVFAWPFGLAALIPLVNGRDYRNQATRIVVSLLSWFIFLIVLRRIGPPARTLNFLFPLFAILIACGLYVLYRRIAGRRPRLWIALVAALALAWAGTRIVRGGVGWSHAAQMADAVRHNRERVNVCSERYYVDAAAVTERLSGEIRNGALLIAHVHSGAVEAIQFELLQRDLSPTAIRPVRPSDNLRRIADARDVYAVLESVLHDKPITSVYQLLNVDSATLAQHYAPPRHVARFLVTDVYHLERLSPPDTTYRPTDRRISYPR